MIMVENADTTTTDSAPEAAAQKPATKGYRLRIEQTRYYYITVEAETIEQAKEGWEANNYEYSASFQPEYEWNEEVLADADETGQDPENAEIDYERVCGALDLPYSEEWDD